MNRQHLTAFIWLRYRLRVNQLKRGGIANQVLLALLAAVAVFVAIGAFFGGFLIGLFAFRHAPLVVRMWVWDGLIIAFLFSWMIGLLTELQRTDALSLDKFLHLPVSLVGAFAINYVSSLASLSLLLFVPGMTGLILGQTFAEGPQMLLAFPLLAAFVLAITALTYQFQGWLATLMTNPRRRRTVIVVVTMSFVLFFQLPNLVNVIRPWEDNAPSPGQQYADRKKEIGKSLESAQISPEEYQQQIDQANKDFEAARKQAKKSDWDKAERTTRVLNTALPPGWLAFGAADLADHSVLPALLGMLGLSLAGSLSLWRAYRTTLRFYSGHDQSGGKVKATAAATPADPAKVRLIEWQLPGVPERVAGIATAAFQSILRAPEAKMALILPIILVLVFGSIFLAQRVSPPMAVRPLMAFGAIATVLVCSIQLAGNQFGYDRAGFRAYVLSPVPRRDILLGKNLAMAPVSLTMIAVALVALECFCPMRIDYFLMTCAQAVAMFLLFCLLANLVSIVAPIPIAPGAMKATQVKLTPVLCHLGLMFAFPLVYLPLLAPLGLELLLAELTGIKVLPVALPLTLAVLVGVVFVYRWGMIQLGRFLSFREQKILEIVTSKSE